MNRRDQGSASVVVLGVGLTVILVAVAFAAVGGATVARHRAQAAADLAALAGAAFTIDGEAAACQQAARVAGANRARLTACIVRDWDLVVQVEVQAPACSPWCGGVARAWARAGPAPEEDRVATAYG